MSEQAVVVGAGHNGLVAAIMLADAGWDVLVLEEQPRAGGAVFSDRSLHPEYVTDWFSAFYPLGGASPVLARLDLERCGLEWSHAPAVLAHVLPDDRCVVQYRDLERTAASLDEFADGDGEVWRRLTAEFEQIREPLLRALFSPFPPVRAAGSLVRELGVADLLRFARFAVQSVRAAVTERFAGEGAALLLAGNAMHSDLAPEAAASALYGWLLGMLGQTVGFPVPVGGSGALVDALVTRLSAAGGELRLGTAVREFDVSDGKVRAVRTADGERIEAPTVIADVSAPTLYEQLIGGRHLPPRLLDDLRRFQWDSPTMKIDWALSGGIPWTAKNAREAGTVHLGVDLDGMTRYAGDLATGTVPRNPFVIMGQMTTADPSRSPAGTESAWAYTHLPQGVPMAAPAVARQVKRVEAMIEARAPGFIDTIQARRVLAPRDLERLDANLTDGAVAGGTASIHQQLIFRPVPGLGRPETPVDGIYLASASAHPGGGVHGAPGSNAALAALHRTSWTGGLRRRLLDAAQRRIYR
jgi:phytoene dehydrogenase-like protein